MLIIVAIIDINTTLVTNTDDKYHITVIITFSAGILGPGIKINEDEHCNIVTL